MPTSPKPPARWRTALLAAALLAVPAGGLRLVCILRAETIARDGTVRLHMARELMTRPTKDVVADYDYHPGYSAMVGAVSELTGAGWPDGWILAAQLVSMSFGLVGLAAFWFIAEAVFGRTVAWLSTLVAAASGPLIAISSDALSDMPAVALALVAVALGTRVPPAVQAQRARAVWLGGAAGLVAGLAYLIRPEALLGALVSGVLLLRPRGLGRRGRLIQAGAAAALIVGALVAALPYAMSIGALTQKKSLSDFLGSVWQRPAPLAAAVGVPLGAAWIDWLDAVRRFLDRGRAGVGNILSFATVLWWSTYFGRHLLRLPLPRAVILSPRRGGHPTMFTAAVVMLPLLVALEVQRGSGYLSSRHTLIPFLLMGVAAGAGVMTLVRWALLASAKLNLPVRPRIVVAGFTVAVLLGSLPLAFPVLHEGKGVHRQAGMAIRRHHAGPAPRVLAAGPREPFYAGAGPAQFRQHGRSRRTLRRADVRSPRALYTTCQAGGYDYVAFDMAFLDGAQTRALVRRLDADDRFELLGIFADGPADERVAVFAVRDDQTGPRE